MEIFKIELGRKVKDSITGYEGFVVARAEYLNGCVCYQVEKDDPSKDVWVDEQRLIGKVNEGILVCPDCGQVCKNERGLSIHRSRIHTTFRRPGGGNRSRPHSRHP